MKSMSRRFVLAAAAWVAAISLAHAWLNMRAFDGGPPRADHITSKFRVGFIPVT
jgi:hypothetical protein